MNCDKNNAIIYAPLFFNLILQILYIILQNIRHKRQNKKLDIIKKEISSSQNLNEQRYSKQMEIRLEKLIKIINDNEININNNDDVISFNDDKL